MRVLQIQYYHELKMIVTDNRTIYIMKYKRTSNIDIFTTSKDGIIHKSMLCTIQIHTVMTDFKQKGKS